MNKGSIVERLCNDLDRKEPRYKSPTLLYFTFMMLSPKASKLAVHVVGRNTAIRFAVPENSTLEPNMEWIGRLVAEI